MTDMPMRDTTGNCVGDCNDQVSKIDESVGVRMPGHDQTGLGQNQITS